MARKILLADDSVTAQNMGKKILSDAGYEVATVSNGSAALKRVQEHPPDLIVLDVYMPGYSGLEVCRRLKESSSTAHIPVLLTVGKLEPFKPDEARKVRAEAFVVKPFEASELLAMVQRLETEPPKVKPEHETESSRKKKGLAEVFASSALAETPDPNAEIDEAGWRDRLSIPHKSHQEPEEAPEVATWGTGFRDLSPVEMEASRRDSAFTAEPFVASAIPLTPQDATPEEIAALQAAAAALMGGAAAAAAAGKSATAEVAPAPTKDTTLPLEEISSKTTGDAQATSEKKGVAAEVTPVTESTTIATETKPAESVAKTALPLVEEAGVIDQSEEPLFAGESAPKGPAPSPSAKEDAQEKKVEEASSSPVTPAPVANKEEAPEEQAKRTEEVSPSPVTPAPVAKKEEAPEQHEKKVEEASSLVAPAPAARKEEAPEEQAKKAEEVAPTPVTPTPVAKKEGLPKKEEVQPALVAAADSTSAVSQHWVALPVPVDAVEALLALDREMAQFRAVAAAVEGSSRPSTVVAEAAIAVAEPEPQPAAAVAVAVVQPAAEEKTVPVVAEAALAAAVGAGAEASPEVTPATVATPEKPIAEAEMDRKSAAEMKAAWANWREIRESIVGSNLSQEVVDLASSVAEKPEASPAKEQDKATAVGDPSAIASIVDSVLAELKPRIVEEIAKKLKKD